MIDVPPDWRELPTWLQEAGPHGGRTTGGNPDVVYIVGSTDAGKSTLARWLADELAQSGPVAVLDADPGQGTTGPPTTIGISFAGTERTPSSGSTRLWFVGDTNPVRHLLQMLTGMRRLAEYAASRVGYIIVDSCGLLGGDLGRELQLESIELLAADVVVSLGPLPEHAGLPQALRSGAWSLKRLRRSGERREKGRSQRHQRREEGYRQAFAGADDCAISRKKVAFRGRDVRGDDGIEGQALGLCRADGSLLALARGLGADASTIRVWTSLKDTSALAFVRFGAGRVPIGPET